MRKPSERVSSAAPSRLRRRANVHEPGALADLIASNFPDCPTWFNEGLASLYEQSAEAGGRIVGLTNWRLEGLQRALAAGDVPSFAQLCRSGEGFYDDDPFPILEAVAEHAGLVVEGERTREPASVHGGEVEHWKADARRHLTKS